MTATRMGRGTASPGGAGVLGYRLESAGQCRPARPVGRMTVAKPRGTKTLSGTASALDDLRPRNGWPTNPVAPEARAGIVAWFTSQCEAEGVRPAALSGVDGWVLSQGLLLLANLRANDVSPNLVTERGRAGRIRSLALSLAGELRSVETWSNLLEPLAKTGQLRDRPAAQLDNIAAVFNLAWQGWGRHSHPLELLAYLAKAYDARLEKLGGGGSGNLFRRRKGDPRLSLARGVRRQLQALFGPNGAPTSDGGRTHQCICQIWQYATGCDPDAANLLYYVNSAGRGQPQQ